VTELTARRERILRHVVQEYVALAQPVPSDLIARKYEAELSPATVRNEMAALEEAGLIAQPHTSAGRVPTDRGYRYFVELLMHEHARQQNVLRIRKYRTQRHRAGSGLDRDFGELQLTGLVVEGVVLLYQLGLCLVVANFLQLPAGKRALQAQ